LLEDTYSVADAVVFGSLLISLLKHADRVTSASLAQLVNVIAPIMTEPSGPAWRQATFFPFSLTSPLATGSTLEVKLTSDVHETDLYGTVNTVDAVATHDSETGQTAVFLVNRSQSEEASVTIDVSAFAAATMLDAQTLADKDVYAKNTLADRDRVGLMRNESVRIGEGVISVTLPPVSWTALSFL
jgi:alpha-N-arabinofuranosidase